MDIRTKLVFSLVAVAMLSMLALGALAYADAESLVRRRSLRQLDALAEAERERIESVIDGWKEAATLIASRTALRESLGRHALTREPRELERAREILSDVIGASDIVQSIVVYDASGDPLLTVGLEGYPRADRTTAATIPSHRDSIRFTGVSTEAPPRVGFLAPLLLNGDRVGALEVVLATHDLVQVATNFTGLGSTGEVLVATRDPEGRARLLTPVRHAIEPPLGPPAGERRTDDPVERALARDPGPFADGMVDYRGASVRAATRYLPEVGWGLVVKTDVVEDRREIEAFREQLVGVGFSLSAFAILSGTLLGLRFAKPILDLVAVANRVRDGDLGARADASREDEIGLLALTFNEMGDELERRMTLLQEYKTFFDQSLDMLCIASTDGYFRRVNPAFERVLGWSEADLLGRPYVHFVHPDDYDRTVEETSRLAQGLPTISFENRYRCADGSYKTLRWTARPDGKGGIYAIARWLHDRGPSA